jgi:hypothetical protein
VWVTGSTSSAVFPAIDAAEPVTPVPYSNNITITAYVFKLDSSGGPVFSTYLGGTGTSQGSAVVLDAAGNGYVTGAASGSFPTTTGALQSSLMGGTNAFVVKLSPSGSRIYSTLVGGNGSDVGYGIAVDSSGNVYVAGSTSSTVIPLAPEGAAQSSNGGATDAFVAKINQTGSALSYFTFLGGAGIDQAKAIAVDSQGNAYVAGQTSSDGLATAGAAQTTLSGTTNSLFHISWRQRDRPA